MENNIANWTAQGFNIVVITLLLDSASGGPPSTQGADIWRNQYGLQNVYVAADPNFSMVPGSQVGTPQMTIIDPRTMKVTYLQEGYSGNYPTLENVAAQNVALGGP